IALPAFVAGPLCFPEYRGIGIGIQAIILLGCILSMLYGANSLVPAIDRARDEGPASGDRFARLHRRSVVLNLAALVGGVTLLIAFACRPAPQTSGIIEVSPVERARRAGALGPAGTDGHRPQAPPSPGSESRPSRPVD